MPESSVTPVDRLLAAASSGAVGGLTALAVWELTAAPEVVAALAAATAGAAVYAAGSLIDRFAGRWHAE